MKKYAAMLFLAVCLLFAGCSKTDTLETRPPDIEPTAVYDWMAGESPVPANRIGTYRFGLTMINHAVSPDGIYFIKDEKYTENGVMSTRSFIVYADHGSDTFVKLCGRADCSHDNMDCNAYIPGRGILTFYNGYLYAATGNDSEEESKLIRMMPDGSEHEVVLDLLEFAKDHDGAFARGYNFAEGLFVFDTKRWVVVESGPGTQSLKSETLEGYCYKIDGSEGAPRLCSVCPFYYCGDNPYLHATGPDGEQGLGSVDFEKNEVIYLGEHPGETGYFDETTGYYYKNGAIVRLDYATNTEQVMVQTGLTGEYLLTPFPDCMILASREGKEHDSNFYIYNWSYELVDTIEITYDFSMATEHLLIAETAERLILTDGMGFLPMYYINKSELGTGDVDIHEFKYA